MIINMPEGNILSAPQLTHHDNVVPSYKKRAGRKPKPAPTYTASGKLPRFYLDNAVNPHGQKRRKPHGQK